MRRRMNFKHSIPTILSILASFGVAGTAVMAVIKTPEAEKRMKEAKEDMMTKAETFLYVAPVYLPAIGIGAGTICCILGANTLNKRRQASLISAIALVDKSYSTYKKKVIEVLGDDADKKVEKAMAEEKLKEAGDVVLYDEDLLFYETYSQQYFTAKMRDVREAEYHFNRNVAIRSYGSINELLEFYGLDKINGGDEIGWNLLSYDCFGYQFVDFYHDKCTMEDGLECYIITYPFYPHAIYDEDTWD